MVYYLRPQCQCVYTIHREVSLANDGQLENSKPGLNPASSAPTIFKISELDGCLVTMWGGYNCVAIRLFLIANMVYHIGERPRYVPFLI